MTKEEKEEVIEIDGVPREDSDKPVHGKKEYKQKDFRKQILELRSENPPKPWITVCEILNEEHGTKMTSATAKKIYNQDIARAITVEKKAGRSFNQYGVQLEALFGRTINILDKYLKAIEQVHIGFESSDASDLQKYLAFMKTSQAANGTINQIFSAIKVMQDQQDKIKLEQKNFIYSDIQIRDKIKAVLKKLIKEGKIKVLRKDAMLQ